MKLTSQEEYGLRCILSLAREEVQELAMEAEKPGASLTLAQIAEREGLSIEYAGKLLGVLGRAGLVESVRGRHGGYRLSRPADEICVSEVVAALGGKLYRPSETCDRFSGDHMFCVHSNTCSIRSLWSGLQLLLDWVLSRTTLYDLVATDERNMAEWMRAQLELLSQMEPPEHIPVTASSGTVTIVGPDPLVEKPKGRNDVH
jgi:Rrf2 family protein